MKRPILALTAALLCRVASAHAQSPPSALPTIVHADVDWIGAMRAKDADRIVASYDSSGLFVTANGTVVRGRDSIAALYRRRFAAIAHIAHGGIDREGVRRVNDTIVYEWGHGRMTFTDTAGATHTTHGPYLTVWRREADGAWRIIRNLVF